MKFEFKKDDALQFKKIEGGLEYEILKYVPGPGTFKVCKISKEENSKDAVCNI